MYIVEIVNDGIRTEIHGEKEKLFSGNIVQGINAIDSFSFCMLPDNPGFDKLRERKTMVFVYNTNRKRYEFRGRVLYSNPSMSESGVIKHDAVAESYMGYFCDSEQPYVAERNWTVTELLQHIIDQHNSQVEYFKQFVLGEVSVTDPNDNLYCGIQRENTWDTLKKKLVDVLGGELTFRVGDEGIYLDYLTQIGERKNTTIALSKNMKAIAKETDVSAYVTRLIPLGRKKTENSEERIDITSVNDGVNYIIDETAEEAYGIMVKSQIWDDVTEPSNLLRKGQEWLFYNNMAKIKYSVTALDLSLLDLEIDDFVVGNLHPLENPLLGIRDTARIIKKNINISDETKSTIEVGENLKKLTDIQREQASETQNLKQDVQKLEVTLGEAAEQMEEAVQQLGQTKNELQESFTSTIKQFSDSISLKVNGSLGSNASIILSAAGNEYTGQIDLSQVRAAFANDQTAISISAGTITFNSGTIIINSENFSVTADGTVTATAGTIGGWTLKSYKLYAGDGSTIKTVCVQAPTANNLYVFAAGGTSHDSYADCPFRVTKHGKLYATDAEIAGVVTTVSGSYIAKLHSGGVQLYFEDVLCGTINSKYWSGASQKGISLRVEENGQYIMFSHPSDGASGYDVDYILNYGWSSNYDEMHIFQTSARFLDKVYFSGSGAYFSGLYLYDGYFIKSVSSDGTVGEEMLGFSSGRVTVGSVGCATMLRGTTVYLKNTSTTVTSDRNAKNSIETLPDAYETFFDRLEPVRFKYNEGNSGRYHVGYIAQDVHAALTAAGLETSDFAGYVDVDGSGELGLAYDEFIAVLHKKIRRLETRLKELERVKS